jgi:hypothetical protein
LSVIVDFAFLRLVKAIDAIEQSGLAGPIRSNDSQNFIIPDLQAHLIKGKDPAKAEHEVVNPNFNLPIISHLLYLPECIEPCFLQIAEGTKTDQHKNSLIANLLEHMLPWLIGDSGSPSTFMRLPFCTWAITPHPL